MLPIRTIRDAIVPVFLAGLVSLLFVLATGRVTACDTPVYRYAMYRWEPAPYQVYYFYKGAMDDKTEKLKEIIDAAENSEEKPANVMFMAVDLDKDPQLRSIPPYVKHDWLPRQEPAISSDLLDMPLPYMPIGLEPFARRELPSYQMVAPPPYFMKMYSGELDEAEIAAFVDSPARRQIAKQLEGGKASVLVVLTGTDEAANRKAEEATNKVIQDLAAGKVELYLPPSFAMDEGDTDEAGPSIEFGSVRVDRNDPKEYWFVESLLSIEEDLRDEQWVDKPMVFFVFGRGRALPPCVGKGINEDNLLDYVYFVTGACSCTVKDQNPGMDMLFAYDWYTAADNLANQFGAEEGNEYTMGAEDYFPDLIIPEQKKDDADATTEEDEPGENAEGGAQLASVQTGQEEMTTEETDVEEPGANDTESETEEPAQAEDTEPQESTDEPVEVDETANADESETAIDERPSDEPANATVEPKPTVESSVFSSVLVVGVGLAVALVALFGLTFLVLRPR